MSTHHPFATVVLGALILACSHADRNKTPEYNSTQYDDPSSESAGPPDAGAESTDAPSADETPPAAPAFVAGPGGLPLPIDAAQNSSMPNAGGKMSVFEVPRAKAAVVDELRTNLAADGWTIDAEEVSPGYGAVRLKLSKAGALVDCRVTGDDTKTGIIITLK